MGTAITVQPDQTYLMQDTEGNSLLFSSAGYIQSITDIFGNQISFAYSGGRMASVTDRHGRVVNFDYQGGSHVKRLLGPAIDDNPTGVYATYTYDTNGNLTKAAFPDGASISYRYEDASHLNHITRVTYAGPGGPDFEQRFKYYTDGRIEAVSEGAAGRSHRFTYGQETFSPDPDFPGLTYTRYKTIVAEWSDANENFLEDDGGQSVTRTYYYENRSNAFVLTKIEDGSCGCAAEKDYDSAFRVVQSKDKRGIATGRTYNSRGDLTSLTEAAGTADQRTTVYDYTYQASPLFPGQLQQKVTRVPSVANPAGEKVSTEFFDAATGRLTTHRENGFAVGGPPFSYETSYAYTSAGALAAVDGPRSGEQDRTIYAYHPAGGPAAGMLWTITEPNGAVTTFQDYDDLGNPLTKTDANGRVTTFSYNTRGLLKTQTTADGATDYQYDAQGQITGITYPKGNATTYRYGQAGLSEISDATGSIVYDYVRGNRTSESILGPDLAVAKTTTREYDDNNRLWRTHQASSDFEEFLYDANGNLTHRKQYAASAPTVPFKTTVQGYDFLDRLTSTSVDGDPYHLGYGYDGQGNLNSVTDPIGQTTLYFYDDLGRLGRVVSPETGTTEYTHDEAGNVATRRDNLNRVVSYAYDGLNRLTDVTYPAPTAPVHYRYDDYSQGGYPDSVGRLTEVTDASGLRRFIYDAAGRVERVVHSIDGRDFVISYGYDANGNLESLTYPDGRTITYGYPTDPPGDRIQSVISVKNGMEAVLATNIGYKPFGPLDGLGYGNQAHLDRPRDLDYRLESLAVTHANGDPLPVRGYAYYPTGSVQTISRAGVPRDDFDYDLMDRLQGWTRPGGSQSYTYDANGNRQSLDDNSQYTGYSYDPTAANILDGATGAASVIFTHDVLGNITGWGSRSLVYDDDNRLQRAEDNGVPVGEYVYNSDGQRMKKTATGAVTYFEYDLGGRLIHEYRAAENLSVDYVYLGDEPLAMLVSDDVPGGGVVVPLAGTHGSLSPSTAQSVAQGAAASFEVNPDAHYHTETVSGCDGTLNGNTYTTGPITGDCTVSASFAIDTFTVTPIAGANGSITPSAPQTVDYGQTTAFTVQADNNYHVASVVGCGGALAGSTYTTGPITEGCVVSAIFTINTFVATPSAGANGSLLPSTAQTVDYGQTASFMIRPDAGYRLRYISGCGGTLNGDTYTTWPMTINCTVTALFEPDVYTVTPSVGAHGSLVPSTPQTINAGQTATFTVERDIGYHISTVTGCGGTLDGSTYTTGPITGNCTVTATFAINSYTVTPIAIGGGTLSPSTPVSVLYNFSTGFYVATDPNYRQGLSISVM